MAAAGKRGFQQRGAQAKRCAWHYQRHIEQGRAVEEWPLQQKKAGK